MWRQTEWVGLMLIAGLVGCSQPAEVAVTEESAGLHLPSRIAQIARPTATIQELSPAQQNATFQIEGQVVRQAPLLAGSMYQLQDDSGTVWVLSEDAPPAAAAAVRVVGTLQVEPIRVEGIDISDFYLQESDRQRLDGNHGSDDADPTDAQTDPLPLDGGSE